MSKKFCNCKKTITKTSYSIRNGHTMYSVKFSHDRMLRSEITHETVKVNKGEYLMVYEKDLVYWISIHVFGITFENPLDEAQFLINNPTIQQIQYAA